MTYFENVHFTHYLTAQITWKKIMRTKYEREEKRVENSRRFVADRSGFPHDLQLGPWLRGPLGGSPLQQRAAASCLQPPVATAAASPSRSAPLPSRYTEPTTWGILNGVEMRGRMGRMEQRERRRDLHFSTKSTIV